MKPLPPVTSNRAMDDDPIVSVKDPSSRTGFFRECSLTAAMASGFMAGFIFRNKGPLMVLIADVGTGRLALCFRMKPKETAREQTPQGTAVGKPGRTSVCGACRAAGRAGKGRHCRLRPARAR